MTDTWQEMPLSLQIDHINGDNKDNRIENLRFLCPNCHSQTSTFGSKNLKKRYDCGRCNKTFNRLNVLGICSDCHLESSKEKLMQDFKDEIELKKYLKSTSYKNICEKYSLTPELLRTILYSHYKENTENQTLTFNQCIALAKKEFSVENEKTRSQTFFSINFLIDKNIEKEEILKLLELNESEYSRIINDIFKNKNRYMLSNISILLVLKILKEFNCMVKTAKFFNCTDNGIKRKLLSNYPKLNLKELKNSRRKRLWI